MASSSSFSSEMNTHFHELQNPFDNLPDDLVLNIINKLYQCETLMKFSSVSKRFASLVPRTHSLFLNLDSLPFYHTINLGFGFVDKLFSNLFTKVFGTLKSNSDAKLLLLKRFQVLRHVDIEFPMPEKIDNRKELLQRMAVFGSHFESLFCLHAKCDNVGESDDDDGGGGDGDRMGIEHTLILLDLVKSFLKYLVLHKLATIVVHEHPTLTSLRVFGLNNALYMGEQQVKRCRTASCENEVKGIGAILIQIYYMPVLELKTCGKVLKKASIVLMTPSDKTELEDISFPEAICTDIEDELSGVFQGMLLRKW